ncbi:MAG: agmatine deiminase family protein [Candidatus Cloacimonetes bacterium]|nr:agmatine deiminase family protein [Candidatus Cloacimonadota bacterium]
MKKFSLIITLLFCFSTFILADTVNKINIHYAEIPHAEKWYEEHPGELPIWLTEEELLYLDEIGKGSRSTLEPPAPVRQPSEFEPMQGVLVRYPLGISTAIVAEMAEDVIVYCVVSSYNQTSAYNAFNNAGVNMDNVEFIITSTDTYWIRDYGPWFIFNGNNEAGITDFDYNRPRPNDDAVPSVCSTYFGINYYLMNLIATGGNYMTDGHGISVSTDLVWEENPSLSHAEINTLVEDYLGIETYHVVPDVNGEYIKHVDCWGKYLSPTQILIREVPTYHSQYDEIEAAVDYFESQPSCYGTNYEVPRVNTPNNQPYTNSLILNNKVLVPITGSAYDSQAIASYEAAMPGYEVLGFTGSWQSTDALHCRTMGVTDQGMLYIYHIPVTDTVTTSDDITIIASIYPYSGEALILDSLLVYWKRSTDIDFNELILNPIFGNAFTADIPAQPNGTTIQYYIHAADNSDRSENNPYIGAPMAYSFYVMNSVSVDEPQYNEITEATNYPNPFTVTTTIAFTLTHKPMDKIVVGIYNIKGQLVRIISASSENTVVTAQWDGKSQTGQDVPAGVYFYRITLDGKTYTQKMLKVR